MPPPASSRMATWATRDPNDVAILGAAVAALVGTVAFVVEQLEVLDSKVAKAARRDAHRDHLRMTKRAIVAHHRRIMVADLAILCTSAAARVASQCSELRIQWPRIFFSASILTPAACQKQPQQSTRASAPPQPQPLPPNGAATVSAALRSSSRRDGSAAGARGTAARGPGRIGGGAASRRGSRSGHVGGDRLLKGKPFHQSWLRRPLAPRRIRRSERLELIRLSERREVVIVIVIVLPSAPSSRSSSPPSSASGSSGFSALTPFVFPFDLPLAGALAADVRLPALRLPPPPVSSSATPPIFSMRAAEAHVVAREDGVRAGQRADEAFSCQARTASERPQRAESRRRAPRAALRSLGRIGRRRSPEVPTLFRPHLERARAFPTDATGHPCTRGNATRRARVRAVLTLAGPGEGTMSQTCPGLATPSCDGARACPCRARARGREHAAAQGQAAAQGRRGGGPGVRCACFKIRASPVHTLRVSPAPAGHRRHAAAKRCWDLQASGVVQSQHELVDQPRALRQVCAADAHARAAEESVRRAAPVAVARRLQTPPRRAIRCAATSASRGCRPRSRPSAALATSSPASTPSCSRRCRS